MQTYKCVIKNEQCINPFSAGTDLDVRIWRISNLMFKLDSRTERVKDL